MEARPITFQRYKSAIKRKRSSGFTLLELLVVLAIISMLMGILLPAAVEVRRQARTVVGMSNQRQIVNGVNLFAMDNRYKYPESVATIGSDWNWNWQAPFVLTSIESHAPHLHRAMSEYLRGYIKNAGIMFCPNAPQRYKYLQQAWDAGDAWDNPDTWLPEDWVKGTYCFYWNYTGLLENQLFEGPRDLLGGRGQSELLVSCYFGYDHWCSQDAYGSCERFSKANITPEKPASSAYWSRPQSDGFNLNTIDVRLCAGYTDGHVDSFTASQVETMKVIKDRFTCEPYTYGPGDFYLPIDALH
jgi:prepilin-type N-terminal cleavage/methylation domain-containing protein